MRRHPKQCRVKYMLSRRAKGSPGLRRDGDHSSDIAEFVRNFGRGVRRDIPTTQCHENGMSGGELPAIGWFTKLRLPVIQALDQQEIFDRIALRIAKRGENGLGTFFSMAKRAYETAGSEALEQWTG